MALLLQALLPSRKVPLRPLLPGSFLIGIGLTTLNLAVSKVFSHLEQDFKHGFIGGFLVLTVGLATWSDFIFWAVLERCYC